METLENTEVVNIQAEEPQTPQNRKIKIEVSATHSMEELQTVAQAFAYAYANIPIEKLKSFNEVMERKPGAVADLLGLISRIQKQKEAGKSPSFRGMMDLVNEVSEIFS